jgi:hypothetical protein
LSDCESALRIAGPSMLEDRPSIMSGNSSILSTVAHCVLNIVLWTPVKLQPILSSSVLRFPASS